MLNSKDLQGYLTSVWFPNTRWRQSKIYSTKQLSYQNRETGVTSTSKLLLSVLSVYFQSVLDKSVCRLTCVGSVALGLCSCAGAVVGVQLLEGHAVEVLRRGGAAPALSHAGEAL